MSESIHSKRRFYKRPVFYLLFILVFLLCSAAIGLFDSYQLSHSKRLSLAGYTFLLPSDWEIRLENELAVFYHSDSDAPIGMARLVNRKSLPKEFGKWLFFETEAKNEKQLGGYPAPLTKQVYEENGSTKLLYVFSELANPQPYHVAVYFEESAVSNGTIRRILKSFTIPDVGPNPPPKSIAAPAPEELSENTIYTITSGESVGVFGKEALGEWLRQVEEKTPASLNLLTYQQTDGFLSVSGWQYLDYDGSRTLRYTYYQTQDGIYDYNNNPDVLTAFTLVETDDGNTALRAQTADGSPLDVPVFSFPTKAASSEGALNLKDFDISDTGIKQPLGEVVYSSSVTIHSGQKVTHPFTGKRVVVDPYAKRYGYAKYLGKPIRCTIYRIQNGYRAVATCGGTVLLTQTLATERDKDNAIRTIQAYGGY